MDHARRAAAAVAIALVSAQAATTAEAAALYAFTETAAGVEGVLGGSIDLTGLTAAGTTSNDDIGLNAGGAFLMAGTENVLLEWYDIIGPTDFGPGSGGSGISTGLSLRLMGGADRLGFETAFTGGAVSGTLDIAGATFASLGVIAGDYVFTLRNAETLTVRFGSGEGAEVPLPAGLPLLAGAFGLLALARRRAA